MSISAWVKSIYSEPDGSGSSTRIHITAFIAFIIGIGISFGVATHHKKFTLEQFDSFLTTASTFIVTTCGPLYAVNKTADFLKKRDEAKANSDNQPGA